MAHVMTYEEIVQAAEKQVVVWEEIKDESKLRVLCFDGVDFVGINPSHYLLLMECDESCLDYNWKYRLWNNMPTERERRNTKWNEDPYKELEDDT